MYNAFTYSLLQLRGCHRALCNANDKCNARAAWMQVHAPSLQLQAVLLPVGFTRGRVEFTAFCSSCFVVICRCCLQCTCANKQNLCKKRCALRLSPPAYYMRKQTNNLCIHGDARITCACIGLGLLCNFEAATLAGAFFHWFSTHLSSLSP